MPRALKPFRENSYLRQHDRTFAEAKPDAGGKEFLQCFNIDNPKMVEAYLDASLIPKKPDQELEFERFGRNVADNLDHEAGESSWLTF